MQQAIQRTFDILLSFTGILITLPLLLAIFILGLFDTGSPIYHQKRVGKNRHLFTLIKFRTMALNTRSVGTHLIDGSSVTKYGKFLRKTKLDELPQLFNVLLGQMSLVGPRPCLPSQVDLVKERQTRGIFMMKPGITGLGQIYNIDMSTPRKLARYDQLMLSHMSLKLYFQLVFSTAVGKGAGDRIKGHQI